LLQENTDLEAEPDVHLQTMNDGGDIELVEMAMFSQYERAN